MTTCPKCQSNKVTKRYFAVGDWCKALVGHYRYFCFDCGHQWAATGKNIVSPSAISEMQSALGAKSQAAEVLMLEAAEKIKGLRYVSDQYKQLANRADEENQKLRDELKLIRSENVAQRNKALEDMGRETELKFWRNEVAKLQQESNIAKARKKKLWIANGKLKQENEELAGALNNLAGKEQELQRRIKVHEDYEKQHHERLIDLVIKWHKKARDNMYTPRSYFIQHCANELEKLI